MEFPTISKWASTGESLSLGFPNNQGTDQPVHTHRLLSAFVIHLLARTIPKLASSEISIFWLVSIADEMVWASF